MSKKHIGLHMTFLLLLPIFLFSLHPNAVWNLKVTVEQCSVHQSPSSKSQVISVLTSGTSLESYEKVGEWYRIVLGPDEQGYLIIGYINSRDVETISPEEQQVPEIWPDKPHYFQEVGFTIRLFTGIGFLSDGEVKKATSGMLAASTDQMISWGLIPNNEFHNMRSIFEMGGEVLYNITQRFSVGLGFSSLKGGEIDIVRLNTSDARPFGQIDADLRFNSVPIKLILKYTYPLSRLFNLSFTGAPTLYITKLKYAQINPHQNTDSHQILTKSNSLGFSGIVGLEFNLSTMAVFFIEAMGKYANLSGFTGEQTVYGDALGSVWSDKTEGTLYYITGYKHPFLVVSSSEPTGYGSAKKAGFNLSGLSLRAGISLRF